MDIELVKSIIAFTNINYSGFGWPFLHTNYHEKYLQLWATLGIKNITKIESANKVAEAISFEYEDNIIFSFIISNKLNDWVYNFMAGKKVTPYDVKSKIKVHEGYYLSYLDVKEQINDIFSKSDKKNLICIGYSSGAAYAQLSALDLQYNFKLDSNDITVITLGGSILFNKEGAESYNKRIPNSTLYENGNDIVTKNFIWLGYKKCDKVVRIGKMRRWLICSFADHYPNVFFSTNFSK